MSRESFVPPRAPKRRRGPAPRSLEDRTLHDLHAELAILQREAESAERYTRLGVNMVHWANFLEETRVRISRLEGAIRTVESEGISDDWKQRWM